MTKTQCTETITYIEEQFPEFKKKRNRDTLEVQVTPQLWNPTHERMANLGEMYVTRRDHGLDEELA